MVEFINFFTQIISKYVELLFSLELLEGVSVGSFVLGCAIFSIVIGYLLGRFTISANSAESMGATASHRLQNKQNNQS